MGEELLKEAFSSFLNASKSLENYFIALQQKVDYLTKELERANIELKRSLEEKEKAKDFLETVLNSIEEAILVLDSDERVLMINRGAENLLNIKARRFIGKDFAEVPIKIVKRGENHFLVKDGRDVPVIYSEYHVKRYSRQEKGKIVVIKDISQIKEMENHYERNKRLIAMGEMAAKIVHEIRSPLCSIELFASMLTNEDEANKRQELINGIVSGIGSLNNILSNMLYFAKERKVKPVVVYLPHLIEEVLSLFKPMMVKRGVKLNIKRREIFLYCDPDLLKQAIFNLLKNAYQAIVEEEGIIEIALKEEGDYVTVSIKDTGVGISKGEINKIFDPFYTTRDSGTGLGLAITLRIIEAHNGFIKVQSEPGKGAEFKIFLPKGGVSNE